MLAERLSLLCKVALGVLPVYYCGLIIAILPDSITWGMILAVVLVVLLVLVAWLGWPLKAIWPVFPGAILIVAGALTQAWLPLPVAAIYMLWGVHSTWSIRPPT